MYHCKSGKLAATSQKFSIFRETDESEISQKKASHFSQANERRKNAKFLAKIIFLLSDVENVAGSGKPAITSS